MKKLIIGLAMMASTLCCITSYAHSSEQPLDEIVAVVNEDVITQSEFKKALMIIKIQLSQQTTPMPEEKALRKQVLDQLINKKLQLQMASQSGVNVTDQEVNDALERISNQNNISLDSLLSRVNQEGMTTAEYRSELHDQILLQKLQQQEVVSHVTITPEEVTRFMQSKSWQSNGSKEYRLEDILIPLSDTPSSEEIMAAKNKAQAILAKVKQGKESFNAIAQSESSGSVALQGGDLGWRKLPEIPSAFTEQVAHMKAKEIAGPIETPNGFHIIRLSAERMAKSEEKTPDRKQVENLLLQQKFDEAIQNWMSKLRRQSFIKTDVS